MRLPTAEEYAAFESKVVTELVHDSVILKAILQNSIHQNPFSAAVLDDIEYAFIKGMIIGLRIGQKLAEQDALTRLCSDKS